MFCFDVTVVGPGNAWGFRWRRVAKRNGGGLSGAECGRGGPPFRYREPLRVRGTGNHCRDERPTTIPFCRKREALNREGRKNRKDRELPARAVTQNGISDSPGNCPCGRAAFSKPRALARERAFPKPSALARESALSKPRALASLGFRLAGEGRAFQLRLSGPEMRGVFDGGGWPNGMVVG